MTYDNITYEREDRLALVTINRPEVLNAINPETSAELYDAFSRFRDDDDAWAAILTGAGDKAFSAGNDLKATAAASAGAGSGSSPRADTRRVSFGGITKGFDCPKPLIAAVNGYAMGGGFELALACDIVVASENARFALPEPRVGLVAGAGGVHRLPRHIPLKIAMGLMLTGSQIDASEAQHLGLVNEVVPLPALLDTARAWAERIFECSPISVRVTKECAIAGMNMSVDDAIDDDVASGRMAKLYNSNDVREGPRAFAEKRKPQWTGR
jgi:enoyl-CoA hydratase/carnithine racemase